MNSQNDPTGHAEIDVLRVAGLQDTYANMTMDASAFPCLMCASPIVFYGVKVSVLELEECTKLLRETT